MADIPVKVVVSADVDRAVAGIKKVDGAVDGLAASSKSAQASSRGLAGAFDRTGASAFLASNRSRMLTQQLSQVAQQTTATGNVVQALAVQAADIGLAFGTVGTIVGALAGVAMPALFSAFASGEDKAEDYKDVINRASAALDAYNDAVKQADLSTGALGERFFEVTPGAVAFAEAIEGIAGREALNRIQEAVDLVALFGREAGQGAESIRGETAALAALFDVNTGLAVGRAAINARDRAREMTEAFALSQIELENSKGDLEAQSRILRTMIGQATALANETGGITAEEDELLTKIARALELVELRLDATKRESASATALNEAMQGVLRAMQSTAEVAGSLEGPVRQAANAAADLANNLFEAAKARAQIVGSATRRGGGRGGDPRQFGMDATGVILAGMGGEFIPSATRGGAGGGGEESRERIDTLLESLQTERETLEAWRTESMDLLVQANEQELEILGGHNEAKLRLQEEYLNRLQSLQQQEQSQTLGSYSTLFGNLATAFQSGSGKLLKIGKAFSVAQGLINSYRAYTEVLADPSLIGQPFLRTALAASTLASGLAQVANIKSVSDSGAGGGGAGATGASAAPAPQPPGQNIVIDFQGDTFSRSGGIALIEQINDAIRDGGRIEGILAR